MTSDQYDRLPGTARAIVDTDRSIAAIRTRTVVPFDRKSDVELNELLKDRRSLTARAHEIWGQPMRGDGANNA